MGHKQADEGEEGLIKREQKMFIMLNFKPSDTFKQVASAACEASWDAAHSISFKCQTEIHTDFQKPIAQWLQTQF